MSGVGSKPISLIQMEETEKGREKLEGGCNLILLHLSPYSYILVHTYTKSTYKSTKSKVHKKPYMYQHPANGI